MRPWNKRREDVTPTQRCQIEPGLVEYGTNLPNEWEDPPTQTAVLSASWRQTETSADQWYANSEIERTIDPPELRLPKRGRWISLFKGARSVCSLLGGILRSAGRSFYEVFVLLWSLSEF